MSRRRARDISFKYIYSMYYGQGNQDITVDTILTVEEKEIKSLDEEEKKFFDTVVIGLDANIEEIDIKILSKLKNWTKERIFKIDLAILRLAVYEIIFCQNMPYKVAVNEAVELAKKYGNDESGNFVNGVLREIIKDREEV